MAAMTTALVVFSNTANSRLYTAPSHTVVKPAIVVQRRRVPTSADGLAHNELNVSFGTTDADGNPLDRKWFFGATARGPVNGDADDRTAALALFREMVASDEFATMILTQNYIKA
jgi:hypothetical protein